MADLEDVRRLALQLPGTLERRGRDGTVSWTVRGTGFVWERPLRRGDAVRVRLDDIAPVDLEELVVDAWRTRASQRQRQQLDG